MAKKEKDRQSGALNVADDLMGTTTEANDPVSEPLTLPDSSAENTSGPVVDETTGEVSGEGYDPALDVDLETVTLLNKIVAKDIVPRKELKGGKTWIPGRDKKTNELLNDGSGVWEPDPPKPLYTVFGTANGTRTGESGFGSWVAFAGNFEAARTSDGKRFKAPEVILQSAAEKLLLIALQDIKTRDRNASVSFAFEVGIKTSDKWMASGEGASYEYTVESHINATRTDPLAHLRQKLLGVLPPLKPKQISGPTES